MTARGTDWSLAVLVALLAASGLLTWFAGSEGYAWVFAAHTAIGASLAILLVWKLWRVAPRVLHPSRWERRTRFGLLALALVSATLLSGWIWSNAGATYTAGFSLLAWHALLGGLLIAAVGIHLGMRAKRPQRRDVTSRRQFLELGGIALGGIVAWRLQSAANRVFDLPGEERRFTGSYESGSGQGNAFPTTSWVADDPKPLDPATYRLRIGGLAADPLELAAVELDAGDELEATLDCTGGFYSTQLWRGVGLARLLERAGPEPEASHVRVTSVTGYRWGFNRAAAAEMLLATHVGDEPLSHGHGAPVRLVAPGRRGFQWVKWVTDLELVDSTDYGAFPSTVWSSFSSRGRGG